MNVCSLRANCRKNFSKLQNRFDSLKETQDEDLFCGERQLEVAGQGCEIGKEARH